MPSIRLERCTRSISRSLSRIGSQTTVRLSELPNDILRVSRNIRTTKQLDHGCLSRGNLLQSPKFQFLNSSHPPDFTLPEIVPPLRGEIGYHSVITEPNRSINGIDMYRAPWRGVQSSFSRGADVACAEIRVPILGRSKRRYIDKARVIVHDAPRCAVHEPGPSALPKMSSRFRCWGSQENERSARTITRSRDTDSGIRTVLSQAGAAGGRVRGAVGDWLRLASIRRSMAVRCMQGERRPRRRESTVSLPRMRSRSISSRSRSRERRLRSIRARCSARRSRARREGEDDNDDDDDDDNDDDDDDDGVDHHHHHQPPRRSSLCPSGPADISGFFATILDFVSPRLAERRRLARSRAHA